MAKKHRRAKAHYAPVLKHGLHELSHQVEAMHRAIAGKTFGVLKQLPVVSRPAALIENVHNAISSGVHASVRLGNQGLMGLAGSLEQALNRDAPLGRRESNLRAVINGVFGDHLAAHEQALATPMQLFARGQTKPLDVARLKISQRRVAVFVHGLACDEYCWIPAANTGAPDYGVCIEAEFGHTPIYLRYNSGLSIAENGTRFAQILNTLCQTRSDIDELVLIGHSMGGLVARSALRRSHGSAWQARAQMLICLGSPQLGSPLERLGAITNRVLNRFEVTAPLGAIATRRSAGIRNLHDGLGDSCGEDPTHVELRFLSATIAKNTDSAFGKLIGDGLVTPDSALAGRPAANVATAQLGGLGHIAMLHDARCWQQIHAWLAEKMMSAVR